MGNSDKAPSNLTVASDGHDSDSFIPQGKIPRHQSDRAESRSEHDGEEKNVRNCQESNSVSTAVQTIA
jgi:hypothetical protein